MNLLRVSALAASLLAGCAGGPPATSEPAPAAAPTAAATATSPAPIHSPATPPTPAAVPTDSPPAAIAQKVDIGGRSLYIECRGDGSPTILFLHGFAGDRTHGYHLFDGYADRHRVCVYDRAGMGLSDPAEGVQSGADIIGDLKRLLEAADVPGPHLLVANSFGGVLAEIFAGDQPDEVAGMVLVDASLHADADLDRYFADRGEFDLEDMKTEFASGPEPIHWTIHDEAREALDRIPDVPITYLRASQGSDVPPEAQEIWEAGLDALLARSSNARVVDVEGPHSLPPPPVHEAVDQMLDLLRTGHAPSPGWRSSDSLTAHPLASDPVHSRPAGPSSQEER
jgi:pimeloyl-ACP methyl ester carboxylesterase